MRTNWLILLGLLTGLCGVFPYTLAQTPDINEFIFVQKEPEPLNINEVRSGITYPATAVEDNIQGTVVARVLVDKEGKYVTHQIVKSISTELDAAVEAELPKLTFSPALQDDQPVMYWMNLPFPFKLVDEREEKIKERIEELTQDLTVDSKNYILWHKRAIQRSELKDLEFALGDFTEAIAINPRKNSKRKADSYKYLFYSYYGRGQVYVQQEAYEKAIADFTEAIAVAQEMKAEDSAVQATVPIAYLDRGYAHALTKGYEQAVKDFDIAIEKDPSQACEVYSLMADVGSASDNPSLLVRAYNGLIECNHSEYTYYYSRGYYRSQLGEYKEAVSDMDSVLVHSKQFPLLVAAQNRIVYCQLELGDTDAAETALEKAMDLNAVNHLSHYYRGLLLEAQNKPDEACQAVRKALYFGLEGNEGEAAVQFLTEKCGGWEP